MTALSLYSGGCDGLSLAASWVDIETVAFCESDKNCREQLRRRHPNGLIFHYDTEVTAGALRKRGINPTDIDIILASPPCQCASVAGKRLGAADERNRWPECLRILRDIGPRWFVAENVPGLLSVDAGRLFGTILRELAALGYDAGWCVYGAADVGAPHRRDRLCLVAHRDDQRKLQPQGNIRPSGRWFIDGGDVGDTEGNGLQGQRSNVESLADPRRNSRESQGADRRSTQPGVGGLLDGVLARLAAQRWPAGRGERQYDWEPPRTVARGMKSRADMIKMLGNAVVPQWALIPLAAIKAIEEENNTLNQEDRDGSG